MSGDGAKVDLKAASPGQSSDLEIVMVHGAGPGSPPTRTCLAPNRWRV